MYHRNVLWVLGFQLDSFIVKCVICKTASVGVARGMWWCCYCTWQHYCDILTFRNTCHDFVTAVSGGRHVHYVQADICSCVTRGQLNIIKQPVKLIRSVHCHLHFPVFCVCRAPEPMGTLSLTSDPGLWAEPGVKMGSWGSPRGPWQTSGLLPQSHLNMNGIGIRRNFMNVDTENQSEFHWICPPLPALMRSAARNERVQPSSPHWFK